MIAQVSDTLWVAVLGMIGLTLSTLGVAVANAFNSRKRGRDAAEDREHIKAALQPENGYDSIGQGITAIEQKLVKIDQRLEEGQQWMDTTQMELEAREPRIKSLEAKTAETLAIVGENHALFKNYIESWTPLAARAVGEWGADGQLEKQTVTRTSKKRKK